MSSTGAPLVTIQAPEPLTSAQAAAWFTAGTPAGAEVIGYTVAARAATWIRVGPDGEVQHVDGTGDPLAERSEEHTSELQSRENLVCRLLLEKKKKNVSSRTPIN